MRQAWPVDEGQDRPLVAAVILAVVFVGGVVLGAEGQPYCPTTETVEVVQGD